MLKKYVECDYQEDMLILMKAARVVRDDVFSTNGFTFNFNASFPQGCQQESAPMTLKLLVTMLLRGADIVDQDFSHSLACLSVAHIILFNCKKKKRASLGRVDTPWRMNHLYPSTLD